MNPRASSALLPALLCLTVLGGCSQIRERQGYLADDVLLASVQPGVDNKESVQTTLGRPSFTGQFDENDWYYVSRETKQFGFARPSPSAQTLVHIRFDAAGNVASVNRSGLEQVASITPSGEETPTLGRDRGFFQELFGNIGAVGAGQAARTADNPQ